MVHICEGRLSEPPRLVFKQSFLCEGFSYCNFYSKLLIPDLRLYLDRNSTSSLKPLDDASETVETTVQIYSKATTIPGLWSKVVLLLWLASIIKSSYSRRKQRRTWLSTMCRMLGRGPSGGLVPYVSSECEGCSMRFSQQHHPRGENIKITRHLRGEKMEPTAAALPVNKNPGWGWQEA